MKLNRRFVGEGPAQSSADAPGVDADVKHAIELAKDQGEARAAVSALLDQLGRFDAATELVATKTADAKADVKAGTDRAIALLEIAGRSAKDQARAKLAVEAAFGAADKAVARAGAGEASGAWLALFLRGRANEMSGRLDQAIADYKAAEGRATTAAEKARVISARARAPAASARKPAAPSGDKAASNRMEIAPGLRGLIAMAAVGVIQDAAPAGKPDDPLAQAKADAKEAVKLSGGNDPGALFQYGKILLQEKNRPEALVYLLRAYVNMDGNATSIADGLDPAEIVESLRDAETCLPRDLQKAVGQLVAALNPGGDPEVKPPGRNPGGTGNEPAGMLLANAIALFRDKLKTTVVGMDQPTAVALREVSEELKNVLDKHHGSSQSEPPKPTEEVAPAVAVVTVGVAERKPEVQAAMAPAIVAFPPRTVARAMARPAAPTGPKRWDRLSEERAWSAYRRGVEAFWSGDYARASAAFEVASTESATEPASLYFLGLARARQGLDVGSAWADAAKLERENPDLARSVSDALTRIQGNERNRIEAFRR